MHAYVELAVKAIRTYAAKGEKIAPPTPLPPEMEKRAGVFVSIKKHGELRGCVGTILPTRPSIAEEIIGNAISACAYDSRFFPVETEELVDLTVSVDVLSEPEPVASAADLDAKKYGVIVTAGERRGLLLPDLDGVNTPQEQIEICRRKGSILHDEKVTLQRFTVTRLK